MSINTRILTQVTATEWQAFERFLSYMPRVDDFLQEIGETIEIYDRMLTDEEIGAALDVRKKALLSYPWAISPKDESEEAAKAANLVRDILKRFPFSKLLEQCLTALEFGFAVVEIVWEDPQNTNGLWVPRETILLRHKRFELTPEGKIRAIYPEPKELAERFKFILHRHGISPENPYGVSVLRRCYWPWRFKRAGWQFWLTAAERFGVPSVIALLDVENAKSAQEIEERAQFVGEALKSLRVDSAVAVAGAKEIQVLEARRLEGFEKLIELCNRAITKAITGQILATGEAKHGTRAQATVHENILYEIVDSDARNLAETLNRTLIPWIVELNLGPEAPVPKFEFDLAEETPWERVREAIDRGVPVSRKALYEIYGLPQPEDDQDVFLSPKAGGLVLSDRLEFAEGGPDFFGQIPLRRRFRPIW